ncbi:hypothetical protein BVRB_9g209890 [Beta vulgaris subsp. vulgaris]|nr:hypothetical protein BVRB_9g209890 [Beta vulgaris subsp. vulgaris]
MIDCGFLLFLHLVEHIVVLYHQVELRSPASDAGICTGDIIIQIGGEHVGNTLKFTSVLLDKALEPFEAVVKRASSIAPLALPVHPESTSNLNR